MDLKVIANVPVHSEKKHVEPLRWFGHEERKEKDWARKCMYMDENARPRWRPRKTRLEVAKNDMKELGRCSGPSCLKEDCGELFSVQINKRTANAVCSSHLSLKHAVCSSHLSLKHAVCSSHLSLKHAVCSSHLSKWMF